MSITEKLIEAARDDRCPGCGPTLRTLVDHYGIIVTKGCTCCGWEVTHFASDDTWDFGSATPVIGEDWPFKCALEHPEHRANWPQAEPDENAEPLTELELLQNEIAKDSRHWYYYLNKHELEFCIVCNRPARHKIEESGAPWLYNPDLFHPYTNVLCCHCFEKVLGSMSHLYPKIE